MSECTTEVNVIKEILWNCQNKLECLHFKSNFSVSKEGVYSGDFSVGQFLAKLLNIGNCVKV